jgi:hypothetical protein
MWVLPSVNSPLFTNFDDSPRYIALSCNATLIALRSLSSPTPCGRESATMRCDAAFFVVEHDELDSSVQLREYGSHLIIEFLHLSNAFSLSVINTHSLDTYMDINNMDVSFHNYYNLYSY